MRTVHIGHPVTQRLVDRVFEGARTGRHRDHGRTEQPHASYVERLPPGVLLPHVNDALETEERRRGGARHAVLAGARLGDDAWLAHPGGQQRLAEHISYLVGTRVVEILPLEQDPRTHLLGQARGVVEQARCAGIVAQQPAKLGLECLVRHGVAVCRVQLIQGGDQRLGHKTPTVTAEMTAGVRQQSRRREQPCVHGVHRRVPVNLGELWSL